MKKLLFLFCLFVASLPTMQSCTKSAEAKDSVSSKELLPLRKSLAKLSEDLTLVDNAVKTYETILADLAIVKETFSEAIEKHPDLIPRRIDFERRFNSLEREASYILAACKGEIYVTNLFIADDQIGGALGEWKARIDFIRTHLETEAPENNEIATGNLTNTTIIATTPAGTTFKDCTDDFCPVMTVIPTGRYMMGATEEQLDAFNVAEDRRHWELPRHEVTISKPIAVGVYEITLASFEKFVQETGYEVIGGCRSYLSDANPTGQTFRPSINYQNIGFPMPTNAPVSCITKENAIAYTEWLSKKTGQHYRLPTEAEWEFFARAGTESTYFWGDEFANGTDYANVYDQSSLQANNFIANGNYFTPYPGNDNAPYQASVGSYLPNAFGLYDITGNVREWVQDVWIDDPNGNYTGAPTDGSARTDGLTLFGLSRGGGWYYQPTTTRISYRNAYLSSEMRAVTWGFRVVRDI